MYARVVELVDTLALGASAFGREGSSPFSRTKSKSRSAGLLFDLSLLYLLWLVIITL